jgi:hypothetical protein
MYESSWGKSLRCAAAMLLLAFVCTPAVPAIKNMAVVVSAGSKLADVPLADLVKYCKGTAQIVARREKFCDRAEKSRCAGYAYRVAETVWRWGFGREAAIAKLNETRQTVKIADSDDDLLRTVDATSGAVGVVDVYSINSSVKVLRIDGKLPFDVGYAFEGQLNRSAFPQKFFHSLISWRGSARRAAAS